MAKEKWNSKGKIVSAEAVTPGDAATHEYDALFIGVGGDIAVLCRDDSSSVVFKTIGDGEFLPMSVKRVLSTGTTATDIVGLIVEEGK